MFDLTDLINQGIDRLTEEARPKDKGLRLSESGICPRKRVLRVLEYEEKSIDPKGAFLAGLIVEAFVGEILKDEDPKRWVEIPHPWGIGHMDWYLPYRGAIVEVKGCHIGALQHELPRQENILQVIAQMHFSKCFQAGILYIPFEDPLQFKFFEVVYRESIGKQIEQDMFDLWEMTKMKAIPAILEDHHTDSFPCSYQVQHRTAMCAYHWYCWGAEEDRPAVPVQAVHGTTILEYASVDGEYAKFNSEVAKLGKRRKELGKRLEPVFVEYGDVIGFGGKTITRKWTMPWEGMIKKAGFWTLKVRG